MAISAGSVEETYQQMRQRLSAVVPDVELRLKAELVFEINRLKKERGALILGHNYMEPALFYSVPDFTGDSLELSRKAAQTDCDPIVFCGVRFMAETAKILNPARKVLLPARKAGCSLAEGISAQDVRRLREAYPGVPIVAYINTYADVKAEVDVVCTSGNAARVVRALDSQTVIFVPDEYLARNVAAETGKTVFVPARDGDLRPVSGEAPQMVGWHAHCEVHEKFNVEDVRNVRRQFRGTLVIAHPECSPEVIRESDYSASTSRMAEYVRTRDAAHYLILTECSMADNIIAQNPGRDILRLCSIRCPHMNEITLEDTLHALRNDEQLIEVPPAVAGRARRALERMLEIG